MVPKKEVFFKIFEASREASMPCLRFYEQTEVFLDPKLFLSKFFEVFIYVWIRQSLVRIRKSALGTIALGLSSDMLTMVPTTLANDY
jgi:hypothetical protein